MPQYLKSLIIALITVAASVVATATRADELRLQENAPDHYTVVKGDTLWDISARFLKDPWRWPEVWNMNRSEIDNPHWIYPGDTVVLDRSSGNPRLSLVRGKGVAAVAQLGPRIRIEKSLVQAIPSIPAGDIEPFLAQPLVVGEGELDSAPHILATEDARVLVGTGNIAYAEGLDAKRGEDWQMFRPGRKLIDPDNDKVLGYEAVYLGDARVSKAGNPAVIEITRAKLEINRDDRLVPARPEPFKSYVPHAPDRNIRGRIVSAYNSVAEVAENSIIAINRGKLDGLEHGHVLASYRDGGAVDSLMKRAEKVHLPDERTGLIFVFRVFDHVSYALVMNSNRQLHIGDVVRTP